MAQFIKVTRMSGKKVRINVTGILSYYAEPQESGHLGEVTLQGSDIVSMTKSQVIWVRETPEEIDLLIDPTTSPSGN